MTYNLYAWQRSYLFIKSYYIYLFPKYLLYPQSNISYVYYQIIKINAILAEYPVAAVSDLQHLLFTTQPAFTNVKLRSGRILIQEWKKIIDSPRPQLTGFFHNRNCFSFSKIQAANTIWHFAESCECVCAFTGE